MIERLNNFGVRFVVYLSQSFFYALAIDCIAFGTVMLFDLMEYSAIFNYNLLFIISAILLTMASIFISRKFKPKQYQDAFNLYPEEMALFFHENEYGKLERKIFIFRLVENSYRELLKFWDEITIVGLFKLIAVFVAAVAMYKAKLIQDQINTFYFLLMITGVATFIGLIINRRNIVKYFVAKQHLLVHPELKCMANKMKEKDL